MTTLEFEGSPTFTLAFEVSSGTGGTGTGYPIATQPEAEAGTSNTSLMTPLRTHQAVDFRIATEAEAAAGVSTTTLITPATLHSASASQLWFFDKALDLLAVTVPVGVDVIYRLGYYQRGDHEITRFKRKLIAPTTAPTNNLAWEQDASGAYFVNDMPRIDVRTFGVMPDGKKVNGTTVTTGISITTGTATLTVPGANFTAANVGNWIQVDGAGPLTEIVTNNWIDDLTTTIASVDGPTQVTLTDAASQTVAYTDGKAAYWGTNYVTQLQNCCRAHATMKKPMYFPASEFFYLFDKSLCGLNGYGDIHLCGDGVSSWLMFAGWDSPAVDLSETCMLHITGGMLPRTTLDTPVTTPPGSPLLKANRAGQDIIRVISQANLQVGDWLSIRDLSKKYYSLTGEDPFGNPMNGYQGEVCRIREAIDASHFRLHAMLEVDYAASATAGLESDVREITPVTGVDVHDLKLDVSKPMNNYSGSSISLNRVWRGNVKNCFFPHSSHGAVVLGYPIDVTVDNNQMEWSGGLDGMQTDGDHDPYKGYTVIITGGAQNCRISNNIARNVRHFITGSNATDIAPRHVMVSNCHVVEGRVLVDSHPGADYWQFYNCSVDGGIWIDEVDQVGYGYQIRGNYNEFINCRARNVAIALQPVFCDGTRVINFSADNCDVGISIYNCRNTHIKDAKITNPRSMGFFFHWSPAPTTTEMQDFGDLDIDGFWVYGNPSQTSVVPDYKTVTPTGMVFGYWDTSDVFHAQWKPGFRLRNWHMDECTTPFMGVPYEAAYGPGIPASAAINYAVIAESPKRELHQAAALAVLTSGTTYMQEIDLEKGRPVAALGSMFGSAGTTVTNLWFGLYDKDRNLLARTSDKAAAPTPDVMTQLVCDRIHRPTYTGRHYIGITCAGAAMPTVYGRVIPTPVATLPPIRSGASNTGLTAPASAPAIASATSVTSLDLENSIVGTKKIITQSGKAFVEGMRVKVARTSDPTKYMLGWVTTYSSTTLWVCVDSVIGTGTAIIDWTITGDAVATAITPNGNQPYVVALGPWWE